MFLRPSRIYFVIAIACAALVAAHHGFADDDKLATDDAIAQTVKTAQKAFSKKLKEATCRTCGANTDANIIGNILPCSPTPINGADVHFEMATDLCNGSNETGERTFIQYIFCVNRRTGELALKHATSIVLKPGVGVCGIVEQTVNNIAAGQYRVFGEITVANADGSETILARKACDFSVR